MSHGAILKTHSSGEPLVMCLGAPWTYACRTGLPGAMRRKQSMQGFIIAPGISVLPLQRATSKGRCGSLIDYADFGPLPPNSSFAASRRNGVPGMGAAFADSPSHSHGKRAAVAMSDMCRARLMLGGLLCGCAKHRPFNVRSKFFASDRLAARCGFTLDQRAVVRRNPVL